MFKQALLLPITILLLFSTMAQANEEDLVFFDLSFAGYHIGMTYDEATAVRPFDAVNDLFSPDLGEPFYSANIDKVYVDDIEMALQVDFVDDKIQKIVGRFHPSALEDMIRRFHNALGPGENKSRVINNKNGGEYHQVIFKWDFPTAKMHLIGLSSNSEFAVVGLVAKTAGDPGTPKVEAR
jgi:hypothetical protein